MNMKLYLNIKGNIQPFYSKNIMSDYKYNPLGYAINKG